MVKLLKLTSAAVRGDYDSVLRLLQKGVNVSATNMFGDTALSSVFRYTKRTRVMDIFELLFTFGADINIKNDRSETPLFTAAKINFNEAAELLLELRCETASADTLIIFLFTTLP